MTATAPPRVFIVLALFVIAVSNAYAQSEEEIIARYRQALQKSVDENIQTIEAAGEFAVQNLKFPATIYYKAPGRTRVEMTFQSLTFLQVTNDSLKWEYNPLEDKHTIESVTSGTESSGDNRAFDFVSPDLLNYKDLNYQVKVLGRKKIDSLEVHVLELKTDKKSSGRKSRYFIDTRSNLLYKIEDERGYRCFTNYRNFDGIVFPTLVVDSSTKDRIEMSFNELQFNVPLEDSLFTVPETARENNRKITDDSSVAEADELIKKADQNYNDGKYDDAVEYYSRALTLMPNSFRAHNSRGLAQIERGKYYDAIADFVRAMELDPTDSRAVNNLGLAKYYLGDYDGAVKDYSTAITITPSFVIAIKNRGIAYMELERYEEAAGDFASAVKLNPEDGIAHFNHGQALAQLEKYEDAIDAYNRAEENEYIEADLFNYRGVSEYQLERYANAQKSFEQAVKLAPGNLQYLENYGRTYYEMGDFASAADKFDLYISKQGDQPEIYNLNGLCKYQDENYKGAIKDFSKSIQLSGENATYYDNRAAAKEMIDDYEGAISDYSESIRLYPNDPSVFYKRGLLKIYSSKKMEGCMDLATANEMKFEAAKEAIMKNCY